MKTIRRIILAYSHITGSAHTNRMLCFAKGYQAAGKEVIIVCIGLGDAKPFGLEGITVHCIFENKMFDKISRRLLAQKKMVKIIKDLYDPSNTVIHIYRTPLWTYCFNNKKFDFFVERGEVPYYAEIKSLKYNIEEWLGLKLTKRATGMLVQTYALKRYYSDYGIKYVDVINMFVDISRFKGLVKNDTEKYIAYCGNISKHKDGVDDLIRAFKKVHDKYPEWGLKMIGGFERLYNEEEEIKLMVDELGLGTCVDFTGRVDASEMPNLLFQASIVALARPQSEQAKFGFPTKVGEYLCSGNPCVLTKVGELGMYLDDKVTCIFAEPNNSVDFAEKLNWVIDNYNEAKKIAANGRLLVDSDFSMYKQSEKAIRFMQNVINIKYMN